MIHLLLGFFLAFVGHTLAFFQLNIQFKSTWWQTFPGVFTASLIGVPCSMLFIYCTRELEAGFGNMWTLRLSTFAVGMIVYAIGNNIWFGEGYSHKLLVSMLLAITLVCVQVFWKTTTV